MVKPPLYLDLRLFPNRSLSPRQFRWLMALVILLCLIGGLRFWVLGAWPVALFFALDALLVYWAFRVSYRTGRGFEEVRLDDRRLLVRQVHYNGQERRTEFEPHWVKVELARERRLRLVSHGRRLEIARFLSSPERAEVAAEINAGLARRLAAYRPSTSAME